MQRRKGKDDPKRRVRPDAQIYVPPARRTQAQAVENRISTKTKNRTDSSTKKSLNNSTNEIKKDCYVENVSQKTIQGNENVKIPPVMQHTKNVVEKLSEEINPEKIQRNFEVNKVYNEMPPVTEHTKNVQVEKLSEEINLEKIQRDFEVNNVYNEMPPVTEHTKNVQVEKLSEEINLEKIQRDFEVNKIYNEMPPVTEHTTNVQVELTEEINPEKIQRNFKVNKVNNEMSPVTEHTKNVQVELTEEINPEKIQRNFEMNKVNNDTPPVVQTSENMIKISEEINPEYIQRTNLKIDTTNNFPPVKQSTDSGIKIAMDINPDNIQVTDLETNIINKMSPLTQSAEDVKVSDDINPDKVQITLETNIVNNKINDKRWKEKDGDKEAEELLRASKGLNRANKQLVKTFTQSDVLIIDEQEIDEQVDNWEDLFDEDGSLDSKLLTKVTKSLEDVSLKEPEMKCDDCQHKKVDPTMAHVVEMYDFPTEFQTRDLLTIFESQKPDTYHIKWVDDNHALGVFVSEAIAQEILKIKHPLIKLRPMNEASKQSLAKAKKNPNSLMPVMARPQTCSIAAKRMVTGALGLRLKSTREDRQKEQQILKEAREKKRLQQKQQDDAWEGRIPKM